MSHTLRIEVGSSHNPAATPLSGQYPVAFIRKQLAADEVYPADQRYDSTSGQVQYTPDGGTTWENAPTLDPRNQTTRPPQTGAGADCNSAASAVEWLKRYITLVTGILTAGGTLIQGISAIVGFLGIVGGYGILWEVISGIFGTLQTYGATLINAAMTSTVYDKLKCIIYCNLNANNQVDAISFTNIQSEITSQIGSTAGIIINGLLTVMGWGGLNNVMAMALATDTCGGCTACTWCYTFDFSVAPGPMTVVPNATGTWQAGIGWKDIPSAVVGKKDDLGLLLGFTPAAVTSVTIVYAKTAGSGGNNVSRLRLYSNGSQVAANDTNTLGNPVTKTLTASVVADQVYVDINSSDVSATIRLFSVTLHGTGDSPFGASNC